MSMTKNRGLLLPVLLVTMIVSQAYSDAAAAAAQERPDLTGRVIHAETGEPVEGATVIMYTAQMRTGTNPVCPSCYADCGKNAATDAAGQFRVASLDPNLIFNILIVCDGYRPKVQSSVDPQKEAIEVAITPHDPERFAPGRVIRGRVLDQKGKPVFGAMVRSYGKTFIDQDRVISSRVDADPMAVTNRQGEFVLTIGEDALSLERFVNETSWTMDRARARFGADGFGLGALVSARGLASRYVYDLTPSESQHIIRMTEGVMISGRAVLPDGSPLADVEIGIAQTNRRMGRFLGDYVIGTREDGRFELPNLPADEKMVVFGKMQTVRDHGAIPVRRFTTRNDGEWQEVGELRVQPAFTIRGRIALSDGEPIPEGTRLTISRREAWDSQFVDLPDDGSFVLHGIPNESVSVSGRIDGYHLSLRNPSLDLLNRFAIVGTVEGDMDDLVILYEPGAVDREEAQRLYDEANDRGFGHAQPYSKPLRGYAEE